MGVGLGTESPAVPLAGLATASTQSMLHSATASCLLRDGDDVRSMLAETGVDKLSEQLAIRRARRCEALAREVFQAPELASALAVTVGLRAACKFSIVSREHGEGMRSVLPTIRDEIPPSIFVMGGSSQGCELATVECFTTHSLTSGQVGGVEADRRSRCGWATPRSKWSRGATPRSKDVASDVRCPTTHSLTSGSWEISEPMPTQRRWCGATVADGRLYVIGGHNGTRAVRTAECFDIAEKVWAVLPDMKSAREACVVAHVRGRIFVFGGSAGEQTFESVEQLELTTLQWSLLPPMPTARDACAVAEMNGSVFLCGGRGAVPFHDSVDRFWPPLFSQQRSAQFHSMILSSVNQGRWEALPPMLTARLGCSAAALRNVLYVCGGQGNGQVLNSLERFDLLQGYWEECVAMPTPRIGGSAVAVGAAIVVFGGHDGQAAVGIMEKYSPEQCSWMTLPSMPTARYACAAAVVRV